MEFKLTGAETADQLIKQLVGLRHTARLLDKARAGWRGISDGWERIQKSYEPGSEGHAHAAKEIAECQEVLMDIRFQETEVGQFVLTLSRHLDEKADRERVLDALNIGLAARRSDEIKKYGDSTASLIYTLQLENSSDRRGEDWFMPPLAWCCHLAFMNKMKIDREFDRAAHDALNEVFNGAWGEFTERPLMERLVGRAV